MIPIDTKMRAESLQLRANIRRTLKAELTKYSVDEIRERFDVLLVGHSNFDLARKNDIIKRLYKEDWFLGQKWPPLCNDIGLRHSADQGPTVRLRRLSRLHRQLQLGRHRSKAA